MIRQNTYSYAYPAATPTRYGSQSTNSAQSPSANPDEDWTKISDLAERRRIQNRIAQRNYRKKLKRRLEDLERRAGSSSASPEQQPAEIVPSQGPRASPVDAKKRRASKPGINPPRPNGRSPNPPSAATFGPRDDQSMFSKQYTRQLSTSPPPSLTYSYGSSDTPPSLNASYPQHAPYHHTLPVPYPDFPQPSQSVYLPPLPVSRPSYGPYDQVAHKPEPHYGDEDMMSNFQFNYPSAPSVSEPFSYASARATSPGESAMSYQTQTPSSLTMSPHHAVVGF